MRKKKLIIISNRGFIGKTLYEYLKKKYNYSIIGLNSDNCNLLNFSKCKQVLKKNTREKCTIIFLSTFGRFPNDDYSVYLKNTTMIMNFINSINKKNIDHLIFFSSTCIYGRPPIKKIINEDVHCKPNGYYGLSKFVSEELLKLEFNNNLTIVRIPGVYGEYDSNKSIISSFIDKAYNNKSIMIYDGGKVLRDYVYVSDVVQIIDKIILKKIFTTINIATGKSKTIKDIIKIIEKFSKNKIKIKNIKTNHAQFDMKFNILKLRKYFKNYQFTTLDSGISKMLDYKKNYK